MIFGGSVRWVRGGGGERPKAVNASMETIFQSRGIHIVGGCGVMVPEGDQKELEGVSGIGNRTKKFSETLMV